MKYKGKKLEGRNTDVLVLHRGAKRIVFKAQALDNYDEFHKMVEVPEPPIKILPGGIKEKHLTDPMYRKKLDEYAQKETDYCIVKSLQISDDLEWETVNIDKPDTWSAWRIELREAGFTEIEILRVLQLCTKVNALDDDLLEQARQDFLAETLQPEA